MNCMIAPNKLSIHTSILRFLQRFSRADLDLPCFDWSQDYPGRGYARVSTYAVEGWTAELPGIFIAPIFS